MINLQSLFYTPLGLMQNFEFPAIFRGEKAAKGPQGEMVSWLVGALKPRSFGLSVLSDTDQENIAFDLRPCIRLWLFSLKS